MRKICGFFFTLIFFTGCVSIPPIPELFRKESVHFDGVLSLFSLRPGYLPYWVGNGFLVSPSGCIVTTFHEFLKIAGGEILIYPKYDHKKVRVLELFHGDLVLLKADGASGVPFLQLTNELHLPRAGEKVLVLSRPGLATTLEVGDKIDGIFGIFKPLLLEKTKKPHRAEETEASYVYRFWGSVEPGQSGSPVFNERGKVVGVIVGRHHDSNTKKDMAFVIPISRSLMAGSYQFKNC